MTPDRPTSSDNELRDDLAAVLIDGDIVVYDAVAHTSHVLSGGAVAVWVALEDGADDVAAGVGELTGADPDAIRDDVERTVDEFRELGFFGEAPGSADEAATEP